MSLKLVHQSDIVLRTPTAVVQSWDKELLHLGEEMIEAMISERGIGLAAPQVGQSIRMMTFFDNNKNILLCTNPEIVLKRGLITFEEGCLSLPGVRVTKVRAQEIVCDVFDVHGQRQRLFLNGISAICFQHELDHLNGILMTDGQTE